jgi:uncharacterized protein YqgC (DUF456 family)
MLHFMLDFTFISQVYSSLPHSLVGMEGLTLLGQAGGHSWLHFAHDGMFLAQHTDADLVASFQKSFKHFVESGQVWAMLIGLIIGYFFRAFTTYG